MLFALLLACQADEPLPECLELAEAMCDPSGSTCVTGQTQAACVSEQTDALDCDLATGVSENHARCLEAITGLAACADAAAEVPAICEGVLLFD
jgi:hypothetical protein